jgi:hypothetical protein
LLVFGVGTLMRVGGVLAPSIGRRRPARARRGAVAAVRVATAEIAENPHIFVQILAAAAPKAATAAARAQAATPTPEEGARALPPHTSAPRPNKCVLAFKANDL